MAELSEQQSWLISSGVTHLNPSFFLYRRGNTQHPVWPPTTRGNVRGPTGKGAAVGGLWLRDPQRGLEEMPGRKVDPNSLPNQHGDPWGSLLAPG